MGFDRTARSGIYPRSCSRNPLSRHAWTAEQKGRILSLELVQLPGNPQNPGVVH